MSRIQLALNVSDLEGAIDFYSKLFRSEPAKRKPGYANFAVSDPPLKLVLIENPKADGRLNHLGVEVFSSADVTDTQRRLSDEGLATTEDNGTCCYAVQDKVWVSDPDGQPWEVYTVLDDADSFAGGSAPEVSESGEVTGCCTPDAAEAGSATASAPCCS